MRGQWGGLALLVLVSVAGCREAPGRLIPDGEAIVRDFDAGEAACIARLNADRARIGRLLTWSDGLAFACALLAAVGAMVTAMTKKESSRQRLVAATLSFVSALVAAGSRLLDDPAQLTAVRGRAAMHYEAARRVGKQLLVVSTVMAKDQGALDPERAHELYTFIVERVADCEAESPPEAVQLPDALAFRGASTRAVAVAVAAITGKSEAGVEPGPPAAPDDPPAARDAGAPLIVHVGTMGHGMSPVAAALDATGSLDALDRPGSPVKAAAVRDVLSAAGLRRISDGGGRR